MPHATSIIAPVGAPPTAAFGKLYVPTASKLSGLNSPPYQNKKEPRHTKNIALHGNAERLCLWTQPLLPSTHIHSHQHSLRNTHHVDSALPSTWRDTLVPVCWLQGKGAKIRFRCANAALSVWDRDVLSSYADSVEASLHIPLRAGGCPLTIHEKMCIASHPPWTSIFAGGVLQSFFYT